MARHKEILPSPPRLLKFLAKWMWILSEVKCLPFPFFESPQSRWKGLCTFGDSLWIGKWGLDQSWKISLNSTCEKCQTFPEKRPLFPDEASLPNYQVKLSGQEKKKVLFFFPTLLSPSRAPPPKLPPSPRPRFFFPLEAPSLHPSLGGQTHFSKYRRERRQKTLSFFPMYILESSELESVNTTGFSVIGVGINSSIQLPGDTRDNWTSDV